MKKNWVNDILNSASRQVASWPEWMQRPEIRGLNMSDISRCKFCDKKAPWGHNYCSWECMIDEAKHNGGTVHAPNGLPIKCIKYDGNLYENEHGDHKDYKYPIEVEFIGEKPDLPEWDGSYSNQTHALIYNDECIAISMYECCYFMWHLDNGTLQAGSFLKKERWRLTKDSIKKILGK